MNIVYCSKCEKVLSINGGLPASHRVNGEIHASPALDPETKKPVDDLSAPVKLLEVDDDLPQEAESLDAYLKRIEKMHKEKFE